MAYASSRLLRSGTSKTVRVYGMERQGKDGSVLENYAIEVGLAVWIAGRATGTATASSDHQVVQ
jgi:hypothetical protein